MNGRSAVVGITSLALTLGALAPTVGAQVDTIAPRPLFTHNDLWLAGAFIATTIAVEPFDKHYAQRLQDPSNQSNKFYGDVASVVRTVADPGSVIIGVGMYGVGRLAHIPRAADLGLHGTEAVIIGAVITDAIKITAGRARPYVSDSTGGSFNPHDYKLFRGWNNSAYQSFPSGHTVAAFAAAAAVSNETSRWWPQTRWVIGPAMYGGAALVGLSRMYNNKHWASDVLMGAAIGTFAGNKVVRYHHSHPGNRVDKWLLAATITPTSNGVQLGFNVAPGLGSR